MAPIIESLLAASALGVLLYAAGRWAECYAADAKAAATFQEEFYAGAQKLLKSEATPASVIKLVNQFAAGASRPYLARQFVIHLLVGRFGRRSQGSVEAAKQLRKDLDSLSQPSKEAFAAMVAGAMFSSAASDPILSRIYLRAVKYVINRSVVVSDAPSYEGSRTVAEDLTVNSRELCAA